MRARPDMRILATTPSLGTLLIAAVLAAPGCGAPPANDPSKAATVTAGPATPGICSADGYCWENPVPAGGMLTAAWASGPNDAYVAGGGGRILRFDGTVWKTEVEPDGRAWVEGLWGSGPDDVIAVGDEGMIRHRKGGKWQSEDVEESNSFSAVWGSGPADVFAVGDNGVVFHFDGKAWSGQTTGTDATLSAVWGTGPKDVYAVGSLSADNSGVVMHYDGRDWDISAHVGRRLDGIWGSGPNDVWVAGSDAKEKLSVWRLSKGTGEWKRERVPGEGHVIGLSGAGGKPVVLVHVDTSTSEMMSYLRGQVSSLEWTGSTWEKRPLLNLSSPIGKPAWGFSTDTQGKMLVAGWWGVVGTFQPGTPVSDKEDLRISNGNPALGKNLFGVWGTSPTDVVAVGPAGAMLRYDGRTWTPDPAGKTHDFSAIHGAKDILVAVARQGVLLVRKGGVWGEIQTGTLVDFNGVWTDGDQTFVSGAAGAMFRCDAKGCAPMTTGTKADLWEVWGLGPNEVYVNPSSSGVLRWDGASWRSMLGPKDGFSAIGPDGQGSLMGVTFEVTYRVEQGTWVRLGAGTGYGPAGGYRALGAIGGGQIVGVYGGGGAPVGVRRWDGAKWTDEAFPGSNVALAAGSLRSVWGAEGEVFIVGDGGTIVHKKRR